MSVFDLPAVAWGDESAAGSRPSREETGPFWTFYTLHPVEESSMPKKGKKGKKVFVMVEVDPDQGITIPKFKVMPLGQKLATPVSHDASQAAIVPGLTATSTLPDGSVGDMDSDRGVET
jgi:hypothetical protein